MIQKGLVNLRKTSWLQKLKMIVIKYKHGKAVQMKGDVRIFGRLPIFKIPGKGKIIFGHKVVLNSDFIKSNTALTYKCTLVCGWEGIIEIGDNTMLNGVCITSYKQVIIGKNCQIASSTLITDTDYHPINPIIREKEVLGYKINFNEVNKKEVIIGDNVWIGWGAIILKGVHIGDNSIIAAGSVVVGNVPANVLIAGNPAVIKKDFSHFSTA